ncbi:MAG: hypothetical protein J5725_06205 [Bacteroidales bacterium]|nr:hypothetical protein [Bacteroidales bacterium]
MKRYIKADTEKPVLDDIESVWSETENGSGILFTVYEDHKSDKVLFEEFFSYDDVDTDGIYDSAIDMAILALSQKYELSDQAIKEIKQSVDIDAL